MYPTKSEKSNLIRRYNPIDVNVNGESLYEIKRRNCRHTALLDSFENQRKRFLRQRSVVLQEDPIPLPPPGSLELLKFKLTHDIPFTTDELVQYSFNTLNMSSPELDQDKLNKFYDIVNKSIQVVKSPPALFRLKLLLEHLRSVDAHSTEVASVRRRLSELFGGKSRSRTTHKGRKSRKTRKTRKTRNTRKHRTLRK